MDSPDFFFRLHIKRPSQIVFVHLTCYLTQITKYFAHVLLLLVRKKHSWVLPTASLWYCVYQGLLFYQAKFFSTLDNMTPNPTHLWMLSWRRVGIKFVSSRFELHFCGTWPQNLARHCLSLCLRSFSFFGCEPAETQGRVCLCGFFSVMHPRRRHSRQISLHPRIVVFPLSVSFLFFLSQSAVYHKMTGCHI